jgi:signal transduction histidine kinase
MLQHARDDNGRIEVVDLNGILAESIEFAYHVERAQDKQFDVVITRDLDPGIGMLNLVPQQVSRVFVNLLTNAFSAMKKRIFESDSSYYPSLAITTRRVDQMVEVRMRDNGTGIPEDLRPKIFSPFFTTKSPGEGTGLGLSLCYDIIVNAHGGAIEIDSVENDFTEVIIRLPLAPVPPRLGHRST